MKNLNILKENIIAHRGYHSNSEGIPENTLKAFEKALEHSYMIEFDIHLLKDGTIVVYHDDNLKRLSGIDKPIKDCTYKELKKFKILNTEEKIPTLKEVLKLINGKVPIVIELKSDTRIGKLEKAAMKVLKDYKGFFVIQSFNPASILYFRIFYPNIIRGQLSYDFRGTKTNIISRFVMKNMLFNFITKPDFISYGISSFSKKKLVRWKRKRTLLGWTFKNNNDYSRYNNLFDNIICENMQEYINTK